MIIGKVVGNVVSTRKHQSLVGSKLLIIDPIKEYGFGNSERMVAVDTVGAGIGEIVLVATGSAARGAADKEKSPIDAAVVGIIDNEREISICKE